MQSSPVAKKASGDRLPGHFNGKATQLPNALTLGTCERAHTRSQRSKGKHSRNQWKAKAKQRSDHHRYLRKQFARLKAERDQAKQELKETQTRLRQLESPGPAGAVRPKVDVVGLALHLF
jgi:septal ring factor EnvC (AmiA/AmiB activator)